MLQSKREKILFALVVTAVLVFGGTFLYRQMGEGLLSLQDDIDTKLAAAEQLLRDQTRAGVIAKKFEAMEKELRIEGGDSQQIHEVRQMVGALLARAGLEGKHGNITVKDPEKEEDFKILSISVDQIQCTPDQLGKLLYMIDKESNVMEVERCSIDNVVTETGSVPYRFRSDGGEAGLEMLGGLLSVNMQIARLVEYREGEKPKRRGGR